MSEADIPNLIDLSAENIQDNLTPPPVSQESILSPQNVQLSFSNVAKRTSLDNNPFDEMLKQVNLRDDPFEILTQQMHNLKWAPLSSHPVEMGNLLGLDGEAAELNLNEKCPVATQTTSQLNLAIDLTSCSSPRVPIHDVFSANESPILKLNNADVQGTPQTPVEDTRGTGADKSRDSTDMNKPSSKKSNSAQGSGCMRTQLLKLSVSNSPAGTPLRRSSNASTDSSDTSMRSRLSRILGNEYNDSSDDLNATQPNWVDSEAEIDQTEIEDNDLALLNIPMLQEIEKQTDVHPTVPITPKKSLVDALVKHKQKVADQAVLPGSVTDTIDLQTIRDRVRRHRQGRSDSQEVDDLLGSLKQIVSKCSNDEQKGEAGRLIESLTQLLSHNESNEVHITPEQQTNLLEAPQPMVRQGTFDLDKSNPPSTVPDLADCENSAISPEVSNIVEQIGLLLGNQNVNVLQTGLVSTTANPTYIVVMGTPKVPPNLRPIRQNTQIMVDSQPSSPEFEAAPPRSRSQSLSLHDKPGKRLSMAVPASPRMVKSPPRESQKAMSTPTRSNVLKRRSTISYSPASSKGPSVPRRSTYDSPTVPKPANIQRRTSMNTQHVMPSNRSIPRNLPGIGSDLQSSKLKLKSNEISRRSVGPLKATLPVKKVLPMIVTPKDLSSIDPAPKSESLISTPVPSANSLRPNAYATPSSSISPPSKTTDGANKLRHSYLSMTPNSKSSAPRQQENRRRTRTEFRSPQVSTGTGGSQSRLSIGSHQIRSGTSGIARNFGSLARKNKENTCPK